MQREDVAQVIEIDQEAFPTMWPPPNYQRELKNQLAHYLVVSGDRALVKEQENTTGKDSPRLTVMVKRFFSKHYLFSKPLEPPPYIFGFAGFWIMADEAHLTNIAVRQIHQRQGIGELLLISVIDKSTALNAQILTLEVRISNLNAQNLYHKYSFSQVGIRRGYYLDNKEDAAIMAIENLSSSTFHEKLLDLKRSHFKRWGILPYQSI
jgi:ribosomal-protein-alanine N-acetyltransferase